MAWKRLTFVLIPHSKETIKQIRLHRAIIYGTVIFLLVTVCVMMFYIIGFNGKEFNISRTKALREKNMSLEKEITLFDASLAQLEMRIAHLESLNTAIIDQSGISQMDLEQFEEKKSDKTGYDDDLNPTIILSLINKLEKKSAAFEQNYTALFDGCMKKDDFVRSVPSIRPSRGTITREFGQNRDALDTSNEKMHPGVDITWDEGTPVVATADGIIEEIGSNQELGRYIVIDHLNGYKTRYAHLQPTNQMVKSISVAVGDSVERGDQIGAIGRTGISITSMPSHTMYSVFRKGVPVNPIDYFFASDLLAAGNTGKITASQE